MIARVVVAGAVLGLSVVGWSAWVTRPAEVPLGRHLATLLGQVVLEAVRRVLSMVLAFGIVVALVAASWSFLAPRIADRFERAADRAAAGVTRQVTDAAKPTLPTLPRVDLGDVRRRWDAR